jgi:hypothetical protein
VILLWASAEVTSASFTDKVTLALVLLDDECPAPELLSVVEHLEQIAHNIKNIIMAVRHPLRLFFGLVLLSFLIFISKKSPLI